MFWIRKEHKERALRLIKTRFDKKLVQELREVYPAETNLKDDDELFAEVRRAHARAEEYGIVTEGALRQFIFLAIAAGPAFFDDVWLFDWYMRRGHYAPEERLAAFLGLLIHKGRRLSSGAG